MKRRNRNLMLGVGILCATSVLGTSVAATAEPLTDANNASLMAIETVAPEVLEGVADSVDSEDDGLEFDTEGVRVGIPENPQDLMSMVAHDRELTATLPFNEIADDGDVVDDNLTVFDNNNGSSSTVVARDDGSLQVLTVIDDSDAPTRYDYELSIPAGGDFYLREDGTAIIEDAAGEFYGVVAPAWAKDGNGAPVETRYEIADGTLTQVVEHDADTVFPVVADPWMGITLFNAWKRDKVKNDWRYSAWVTGPGAIVLSGGGFTVPNYAAGQAIFRKSGWDEWKKKWPAITNKATLQQQYNCHVAAGTVGLPFTKDYNLERYRSNNSNWVRGLGNHKCNW